MGVVVVAYQTILLVLWCAPLSKRLHRQCYVAAQVLGAWSGLDVFVVSILAGVLQIQRFALFIIGDKCDGLDNLVARTPLADRLPGTKTCFNVDATIRPGGWILMTAAVISGVVGHMMIGKCSTALCKIEPATASSA